MKSATIPEIKKVLISLEQEELVELCLKMAKYKKENKELLNYLLYEASDENAYIKKVKEELDSLFAELPRSQSYIIKKGHRKILKTTNKYIKYAHSKVVEIELLIYFCRKMKEIKYVASIRDALQPIFDVQIKKIEKHLPVLHEDLQYDYRRELEKL
jgi:hypothetical protein